MTFLFAVLLIGDSHFVGDMGTQLMKMYQKSAMVAMTGAGSITFSKPVIRNVCCPWVYRAWDGRRLTVLESGRKKGMKISPSSIGAILLATRPAKVVIHLGNNQGDDHVGLLKAIRKHTAVPVYWVGIFRIKSHRAINYRIKKAVKQFKNVHYVDVTDLKQLDALHTDLIHYSGPRTKVWASKIWERTK